ncbi:MAG: hypothetical protein GEU95_15035 [Rhizobiales bacterium]|nr:hypothetical protein [Hyphomicrobiales bacterium]
MTAPLPAIPVVDIRSGGPVRRATEGAERVRALRDECVAWLPRAATAMLPGIDAMTRRWLGRSRSPYIGEIGTIAATVGYSGIWFLNGCYQWGCTTLACEQAGAPWLARTLDWPFPGLGRYLEIARMQGPAGVFDNVGWPGYAGALTASAPGRFAAAINQAPLRRRTHHPWLRPLDIALNALGTWNIRHIPPDHLLRNVFETCPNYSEAKHRLETTPIARPAIYSLVGCESGERCVIERTEEGFVTRNENTSAANDWFESAPSWEARTRADLMLTCTYEETAARSRARREHIANWTGQFSNGCFDWVTPPILNPYTRVAVEMCPATGILRAIGYETRPGAELPQAVTSTCNMQQAA